MLPQHVVFHNANSCQNAKISCSQIGGFFEIHFFAQPFLLKRFLHKNYLTCQWNVNHLHSQRQTFDTPKMEYELYSLGFQNGQVTLYKNSFLDLMIGFLDCGMGEKIVRTLVCEFAILGCTARFEKPLDLPWQTWRWVCKTSSPVFVDGFGKLFVNDLSLLTNQESMFFFEKSVWTHLGAPPIPGWLNMEPQWVGSGGAADSTKKEGKHMKLVNPLTNGLNYRFIDIWCITYATINWYKLWRMTVVSWTPSPIYHECFFPKTIGSQHNDLYIYIYTYVEQYLNMTILGFHLVPLILSHSDMDKILCKIHGAHESFSRSIDFSVACGWCQRCLKFNPFWYLRSYILVLLMWGKILVCLFFCDNHQRSILDSSI